MADFKIIETQEDFDRAIQKRLEQKDREWSEKFKGYMSPDDITALKADYDSRIQKAQENVDSLTQKIANHSKEVSELTARAVKAETTVMKNRIANDHNIPLALAGRLAGDTEEELTKDAELFASFMQPKSAPPLRTTEPGRGGHGSDAAYAALLSQLNGSLS